MMKGIVCPVWYEAASIAQPWTHVSSARKAPL